MLPCQSIFCTLLGTSISLHLWFYYLFIIIDLTCMEKVSVMISVKMSVLWWKKMREKKK